MAAVLALALPTGGATERGTDQEDGQNNHWRKDECEEERHEIAPAAAYATNPGQSADDHVKDQLEHLPTLVNS
jgi:hypothetical protein